SPVTGGFGDSQAGGFFGAELKHAGYDAVIFQGKAAKPVYLQIIDGKAELKDASHLWGKTTGETEAAIREESGERMMRFATIGPAGEKLVRYACVMNDLSHAAGRTGMGAVMGSKNLKAVAVRGKGGPEMADLVKVKELAKYMVEHWKDWAFGIHDLGTANTVRPLQIAGGLPTRNFQEGVFEGWEKIDGVTMRDTILVGRGTCYACPVHCKREVNTGAPWNVGPTYGGPEYETLGAFGSLCGVDDLGAVCRANEICNAYSIDTISAGTTIAFAMECFEKGLLTLKDTDGLDLRFGNAEAMVKAVELIGERKGFGDFLAEGAARMAAKIGGKAPEYAMVIKGQELPLHEPRFKQGMGIGYGVSPTGADHCHSIHDTAFANKGMELDRFKAFGFLEPLPVPELSERKARLFFYDGMWRYALNAMVGCLLIRWSPEKMNEIFQAVTGWNTSLFELHQVGVRVATLARLFNLREGFTAADDTLPKRIFSKFESGPLAGTGVDEEKYRQTMVAYYQMMGWDAEGVPTHGKLAELNIAWAEGI
ncbi:MAG: aldehyde ferredoxin oxidoreductase family protein, partial [Chloroflexota bacterium]